jgi:hypothetical protein
LQKEGIVLSQIEKPLLAKLAVNSEIYTKFINYELSFSNNLYNELLGYIKICYNDPLNV